MFVVNISSLFWPFRKRNFGGTLSLNLYWRAYSVPRTPSWKNRTPYGCTFFSQNSILNIKTATAKSAWNLCMAQLFNFLHKICPIFSGLVKFHKNLIPVITLKDLNYHFNQLKLHRMCMSKNQGNSFWFSFWQNILTFSILLWIFIQMLVGSILWLHSFCHCKH